MPVRFLTDEHRQRYGRFVGEPSEAQLARYFLLSTGDLELIRSKAEAHTQLGFALQLVSIRFLGSLLGDLAQVPAGVKSYIARQVGIPVTTDLSTYRQSKTHYRHVEEIKDSYLTRTSTSLDVITSPCLARWSGASCARSGSWFTPGEASQTIKMLEVSVVF